MNKQLLKDGVGWGALLWFIGYILGIILFMAVPISLIGWIISPIGVVLTLWVLIKKIDRRNFQYFMALAVIWTIIAIVLDYIFLVQLFKPEDGYYKLDVYIYYTFTFILPILIGFKMTKAKKI